MSINAIRVSSSPTGSTSKREAILKRIRKLEARKRKLMSQAKSSGEGASGGGAAATGNAGKSVAVAKAPAPAGTTAPAQTSALPGSGVTAGNVPGEASGAPRSASPMPSTSGGAGSDLGKAFLASALNSQTDSSASDEDPEDDYDSQLTAKERLKLINLLQAQIMALRTQLGQEDQNQLDAENQKADAKMMAEAAQAEAEAAMQARTASDLPEVSVESTPTPDGGTTLSVDGYA